MVPTQFQWSDDENEDCSDWPSFRLAFGKYKGATLDRMLQTKRQRSYLRYLLKWDDIRPATAANIQAALDHYNGCKQRECEDKMAQDITLETPVLSRTDSVM